MGPIGSLEPPLTALEGSLTAEAATAEAAPKAA